MIKRGFKNPRLNCCEHLRRFEFQSCPVSRAARPSISWASEGLRVSVLVIAQELRPRALVALAELVSIPTPGQVEKIAAVIADQVNVRAFAAGQSLDFTLGIAEIPVVLLNEDVMPGFGLDRPAILGCRLHQLGPGGPSSLLLFDVEDQEPERRAFGVPVAQKG